jgi:hypothetical protein
MFFCGSGALAGIEPRRPPPIAPGAGLPQRLGCMLVWHAQTMIGVSSQVPPQSKYFYLNYKVLKTPNANGKLSMPNRVDSVTKAAT